MPDMEPCPICFESNVHIFTNVCSHSWCKDCQKKLVDRFHTTCVLCRHPIYLKKTPANPSGRVMWKLHGGRVVPRWYKKRLKKKRTKL